MEEKKVKTESNEQKLSYEKLNEVCNQLFQQNQKLMEELKKADYSNTIMRMNYLFKVVEANGQQFDINFARRCADEIQELLEPKVEDTKENSTN